MARRPIHHDMQSAYVYGITVDGVLKYIGKGRGYRVREHYRIARFLLAQRARGKKIKASRFYNRLAVAMREGSAIDEIIFHDGLSDDQAFCLECELIANFGVERLWNATAGGEGYTSVQAKLSWTAKRRERHKEAVARRWSDPLEKEKHSAFVKSQWTDPEYRKNHIEKQKERWTKPGTKERGTAALKARWRDPEYRKKISLTRKRIWSDPKRREERSRLSRAMWADPNNKKRILALREKKKREALDAQNGSSGRRKRPRASEVSY